MLVDSVCEEDLPDDFFGSVEHAPDEPEYEHRPQRRVQSHAQADGAVAESGEYIHPCLVMCTRPVPVPTPSLAESQDLITHPAA